MAFGLGLSCDCCGGDICAYCTGSRPTLQVTISGFSQTNTPANEPTPPCACTSINQTIPLTWNGCGSAANFCYTANDLADSYSFSAIHCDASHDGLEVNIDYDLFVSLYDNGSGGVDMMVNLHIVEFDENDVLAYSRDYYATTTIEPASTTTDCSVIDETLTLSSICNNLGSSDVWCGGTIGVHVEAI